MTIKYALSTALVLTLLEVVVSSAQATDRVGSALSGIANATKYLLSPAYPLVPDRRSAGSLGQLGNTLSQIPSILNQDSSTASAPTLTMTPSPPKVISV